MRARVIGVGSPHGDDRVGLAVARRLARGGLPPGADARECAHSPIDLLELLEGMEAAVIVDAMRSGAAPGTLRTLARGELACAGRCSSHGIGVAEALALAEALGRLPERVAVVGVEAEARAEGELSPPVAAAVERAAAQVGALLGAWCEEARRA